MHTPSLYLQNKICLFGAAATRFFLGGHKKNKKCGRFGIFYNVEISWTYERIHQIQGQRLSIKCAYKGRGVAV